MKVAIYPGSFDPVTLGHIDIVERAASIFGKVYVAVIKNPEKEAKFSFEDRMKMLEGATRHLKNVKVESFSGLLIDYAKRKKANAIVRGLRAVSDFEYEFQMALTNRKLADDIETIFLMPHESYSYLSSRHLKEVAMLDGDIRAFAPDYVITAIRKKFKK
jgi:pantetheine-phosphate adenylyltransferase